MRLLWKIAISALASTVLSGCVTVKAFQREKLADPIMEPKNQFAKQKLDEKFFSTREGSIGGDIGIGGGCGCAK
ncbi:MAG: DUF4266 domain-containing protein [Calditrichaceae bacterium]|nr:DUF4266 domain-containing protein [Calditrichia bacterium]NUQ42623.1 DUF4266 domain-containing protein [Calditrichaceae bacterium]